MLAKDLNYKKLQELGIIVWQPRALRHPHANAFIIPKKIIINASCLVLSFVEPLDAAAQKIFDGMLGVLQLASEQIMYATVNAAADHNAVTNTIMSWQPRTVLQLSMQAPVLTLRNIIQTYDPVTLQNNTQLKPQAYQHLLTLRDMIHGTP